MGGGYGVANCGGPRGNIAAAGGNIATGGGGNIVPPKKERKKENDIQRSIKLIQSVGLIITNK